MDNGGLRYGAMESALRPPLPHRHPITTATRTAAHVPTLVLGVRRPQNRASLTDPSRRNIISLDPRKQALGGRHQIGTPAGFRSEQAAGFLLERVAGLVGIGSDQLQNKAEHLLVRLVRQTRAHA